MLVDKLGGIVDLVVDHHEEVLLGVVLSNILVRERLLGHFVCIFFFLLFFWLVASRLIWGLFWIASTGEDGMVCARLLLVEILVWLAG